VANGARETGVIKTFKPQQGYGFIRCRTIDGGDLFFHIKAWLEHGYPHEGEAVSFVRSRNVRNNKPCAIEVKPL
jgi:cold shock CspA family protein